MGSTGLYSQCRFLTHGGCAGTKVNGRVLTETDQSKSKSGIAQRSASYKQNKADKEAARAAKGGARSVGRGGGDKPRARGNN